MAAHRALILRPFCCVPQGNLFDLLHSFNGWKEDMLCDRVRRLTDLPLPLGDGSVGAVEGPDVWWGQHGGWVTNTAAEHMHVKARTPLPVWAGRRGVRTGRHRSSPAPSRSPPPSRPPTPQCHMMTVRYSTRLLNVMAKEYMPNNKVRRSD